MPKAEVATAEAASTIAKAASVETRLTEARLMERRTERMTEAAPAGCGSEPAPARPKSVCRRPTRREAAAVTGRCHGSTTTTCVTLSLRWNQRHQYSERRNG
jgi:hypothetical protein